MATKYPKKPMGPNAASVPQRPEDMLHNMKTDARAREMEQIRAMRPDPAADIQFKPYMPVLDEEGSFDSGGVQQGIYDGAGGYRYDVSSDGSVTIVEAPMNRGVGTVLTRGMAYDAIMEELSQSTPNVSERLEETFAELEDAPDLGADDFDISDPEPESEMASGPQKIKPLTGAARLAFLRTKARNKQRG